jgi:arabinose-5-phosphate isomerase
MMLDETHQQMAPGAVASALRTLATERAGLDALAAAIGNGLGDAFREVVGRLSRLNGRVIVTGMGKSGHVGRKIAATLASTGTPAYFVHPGEASHGDLGMIQPEDVILALSWSGEAKELADIIAYALRFRVTLVAVTANADSALGQASDMCLALPKAQEACPNGLAPTTSTTMQMALGDALAVALLEARGFTAEDFRRFHPGGKLGAQLIHIGEIMHTGARLPLVRQDATMADTLVIMSEKGFGCAVVTDDAGALTGIVTDGDLRRHMGPDLPSRRVRDVMTRRPMTVGRDMLAVEALDLLETSKRTVLIVADAGQPIGLVQVYDLLQLGVK